MRALTTTSRPPQGFTLIELIMVITLASIVGVIVSSSVGQQFSGYVSLEQRAQLTLEAESAMQQFARDIQLAVPNSVRVSGDYLELVPVVMAGAYRPEIRSDGTGDVLVFDPTNGDSSFDSLDNLVTADTTMPSGRVVIYNTGLTNGGVPVDGNNIYATNPGTAGDHVITAAGITITNSGGEDNIDFGYAHRFTQQSPSWRFQIVEGALSYQCSAGVGEFARFSGYSIQQAQPTSAGSAPLSTASKNLLSDRVTACTIRYSGATASRNAVVSLSLTLSTDAGESVTLVKQVQISNVP